jgi:hypothetical protein
MTFIGKYYFSVDGDKKKDTGNTTSVFKVELGFGYCIGTAHLGIKNLHLL